MKRFSCLILLSFSFLLTSCSTAQHVTRQEFEALQGEVATQKKTLLFQQSRLNENTAFLNFAIEQGEFKSALAELKRRVQEAQEKTKQEADK